MSKWLAPLIIGVVLTGASPASTGDKYKSDADVLRPMGFASSMGLIFRKSDGEHITREAFFHAINQGTPFYADGIPHLGDVVVTLGDFPNIDKPPSGHLSKLSPGDPMPSLRSTALDGEPVSNQIFLNKLTVIDFFGVDCGGCIAEMHALNAFKATHPTIQTLAVTSDAAEFARDLVQKQHFTWQVAPDAVNFSYNVGVWFYPSYALVDEHGRLLAMASGASLHARGEPFTGEDLARWISRYASQTPPTQSSAMQTSRQ
jgi:peroxiredoxin